MEKCSSKRVDHLQSVRTVLLILKDGVTWRWSRCHQEKADVLSRSKHEQTRLSTFDEMNATECQPTIVSVSSFCTIVIASI